MNLLFKLRKNRYEFDSQKGVDISIPLNFHGKQVNAFGVEKATAHVYISDKFIGDTRKGGGCNFEKYTMVPHCNGTHTECVGHISLSRIYINENLKDTFIPCSLISVNVINALSSNESYLPKINKDDFLITRKELERLLQKTKKEFLKGLVIRTLPNNISKKTRNYIERPHPFFSIEAMKYIVSLNVEHLLVDMASVDRAFDGGKLTAHHIFWNVKQGSHNVNSKNHSLKTITELIYVPSDVKDDSYLLNLQIASFEADASPSRPVLFKLRENDF